MVTLHTMVGLSRPTIRLFSFSDRYIIMTFSFRNATRAKIQN